MAETGMVERASRAMCRQYYTKRHLDPVAPEDLDALVDDMWESWADEAQEALRGIRLPDMNAALEMSRRYAVPASLVDLIWTGMIDTALSPKG